MRRSGFIFILLILCKLVYSQNADYIYYNDQRNYITKAQNELIVTFYSNVGIKERKNLLNKYSTYFKEISDNNLKGINNSTIILEIINKNGIEKVVSKLRGESYVETVNFPFIIGNKNFYTTNKIILKSRAENQDVVINELYNIYNVNVIKIHDVGNGNIKIIAIVPNDDALKLSNQIMESNLKNNNLIDYCLPNFLYKIDYYEGCDNPENPTGDNLETTPNDPGYPSQWWLRDNPAHGHINAPQAWNITTGNSGVVIVVMDPQGFDLNHPEFQGKLIDPYNAVDPGTLPYYENNEYHGTACAGIIAAATNNNVGVASIGWNIKVLPIKVGIFSNNDYYASDEWIINAESYLINRQDIYAVSCSFGFSSPNGKCPVDNFQSFEDSYLNIRQNARNGKGVSIVFAFGNDGDDRGWFPACRDWPVSVGATLIGGGWRDDSNYGGALDLTAPGTTIFTLDIQGPAGCRYDDYCYFYRTSAAAPMVAGVIGLMASLNPNQTVDVLEDRLYRYGVVKQAGYTFYNNINHPQGTWNEYLGHGRLDALGALNSIPPYEICITDNIIVTNGQTINYNADWSVTAPCNTNTFQILNGGNVNITAGNSIVLKPGFTAEVGSNLNCQIVSTDILGLNGYVYNSFPVEYKPNTNIEKQVVKPYSFSLSQNYPNPFNPTTLIQYGLKENGSVKITIYDILGRVVKTLVNEFQDAGYKSVLWDGTNENGNNISSGVYIYKIEAGDFIDSKKMLLIR